MSIENDPMLQSINAAAAVVEPVVESNRSAQPESPTVESTVAQPETYENAVNRSALETFNDARDQVGADIVDGWNTALSRAGYGLNATVNAAGGTLEDISLRASNSYNIVSGTLSAGLNDFLSPEEKPFEKNGREIWERTFVASAGAGIGAAMLATPIGLAVAGGALAIAAYPRIQRGFEAMQLRWSDEQKKAKISREALEADSNYGWNIAKDNFNKSLSNTETGANEQLGKAREDILARRSELRNRISRDRLENDRFLSTKSRAERLKAIDSELLDLNQYIKDNTTMSEGRKKRIENNINRLKNEKEKLVRFTNAGQITPGIIESLSAKRITKRQDTIDQIREARKLAIVRPVNN